jgi:hypothetical protein
MFVNKDSIIIDGISMGQYLVEAKYGYHKLWASDSGRNLAGKQTGTLIGIFPKLVLQFRSLTKEELHLLAPILDSARQTTQYYDDNKGQMITIQTYTGDWDVVNKSINKNEGFSCSFISIEKRR